MIREYLYRWFPIWVAAFWAGWLAWTLMAERKGVTMTDLELSLTTLSKLVGVEVEDNPYDIGYWMRVAGKSRPTGGERRRGWDDADKELKAEQVTERTVVK